MEGDTEGEEDGDDGDVDGDGEEDGGRRRQLKEGGDREIKECTVQLLLTSIDKACSTETVYISRTLYCLK
jgi:hypothetical protein